MANPNYPVSSVETAFRIIEALDELGEAGITEIAANADASNSTVHKHLSTLRSLGYVTKEGTTYALSLGFLGIGLRVRSRYDIVRVAKPAVDELSATTGATTSLVVLEHGYGVHAYRSPDPVETDESLPAIGERVYLHTTAAGKAILSAFDWNEVREIIDDVGLPEGTEISSRPELKRELRSIQDAPASRRGRTIFQLRRDLQAVRDRGVAIDPETQQSPVQCVAAPITADDGPVAAISVAVDREQFDERTEDDLAELVVRAAAEVEAELA